MKITAIDFETAAGRDAVCAVGLYTFGDGDVKSEHHLIDPEIAENEWDPMAIIIHGIRPHDVKGAPNFSEIWQKIIDASENSVLLAHNAAFDMSVLRHSLTRYEITPKELRYICSAKISKKVWPEIPTTRLDYISEMLDIEFLHHDPAEDARASAQIFDYAVKKHYGKIPDDLRFFINDLGLSFGLIRSDLTYLPCSTHRTFHTAHPTKRNINYTPDPNRTIDENHPLFGANVVFTGTLESMNRKEAFMRIIDLGGEPQDGVNKVTNFLVAGEQDLFKLKPGAEVSSKMQKAIDLRSKGQEIEIIGEADFLKLLLS